MKYESSLMTVTPKKAEEFLAFNTYKCQRNRSSRHIQELQEKMTDGRFHIGNIALVINGSTILADGQHTCHASVGCGKPFRAVCQKYTVEETDSKEDVARIFAQFNVDRARSRGDIAWIYGGQLGMDDWPRKCVTLCNTALGWMASGMRDKAYVNLSKDDNAMLLGQHRKQCQFIRDTLFVADKKSRHLMRSPAVAAMMTTFAKSKADAEVFWGAVRDGDMLKQGEPSYVLREYLLRCSINMGAGARTVGKEFVGFREVYAKCIHVWNAYRSGEKQIRLLRYSTKHPLPKVK